MPEAQEFCGCKQCSPVGDEAICNLMASSTARYMDGSAHSSLMAINNQLNIQGMFNVKAQQMLERGAGERLAGAIAQLAATNKRVAGIDPNE